MTSYIVEISPRFQNGGHLGFLDLAKTSKKPPKSNKISSIGDGGPSAFFQNAPEQAPSPILLFHFTAQKRQSKNSKKMAQNDPKPAI